MSEYGPGTYGDRMAEIYDEWLGRPRIRISLTQTVARLADLGAGGRAPEPRATP